MKRSGQAAAAAAVLVSLAAGGCAAGASGAVSVPAARPGVAGHPSTPAQAGFAGYRWVVTVISRGQKRTPIPARYGVDLEFTPNGQFLANDPLNDHFGRYRQVGDGFTTSELAVSAVGSVGGTFAFYLATEAISAFDDGRHASASVSGDQLTVSVGGYRLDCRRDGRQSDFPPAQPT